MLCQQKGSRPTRDQHGFGTMLALSQQMWWLGCPAEVGAAGSSVHHHHPTQWRAWLGWGLAALVLLVLRGWCPGSLTRCGAKWVPSGADKGFPLAGTKGWVPAEPGPAWLPGGGDTPLLLLLPAPCTLHCHLACIRRVLTPVTLFGCDFGPPWGKYPFPLLAPSQADNCHRSQHIPAEMLQF